MPIPPRLIDPTNRADHFYLVEGDECLYFHDYTPRQGPRHSGGNQFVFNLKKSVLARNHAHYQYKTQAIRIAAGMLKAAFDRSPWVYDQATFCPIPPSKVPGDPEYDDRMTQIVVRACAGTNADVRELILQGHGYEASHRQADGARLRPAELEAIYTLAELPPRSVVILVDDVLTTGSHFVAARNVIRARYPNTRVVGFFMARRVVPNPFENEIEIDDAL